MIAHRRSSIVHRLFIGLLLSFTCFAPINAQPTSLADGARLYQTACASCHGKAGGGDGEYAAFLNPRPNDFTTARYKFRTTETGSLPTDADLAHSITEGLHGTAMPSWKPFLTQEQVGAVIAHIKTLSPRFGSEQPRPITMGLEPADTPETAEAGRAVYEKLKCAACHGVDGRGTGAIARMLKDDWGRTTRATYLTEPWTFRGGDTIRDIYLRFRTGMNGTPMPSFLGAASDAELWQLAVFVKTMARQPLWKMEGGEVSRYYKDQQLEAASDLEKHGEYIANITGCAFCHSPFGDDNRMIEQFKFAGGRKFRVVPFGDFISYNLTSDKATGLGSWTDDQIKTFVTRGIRRDGTRMIPYPMPWPNYAQMTHDDLSALVAFLRSLPAVTNRIPPPRQPNIAGYLAGKFRMLILKQDPPVYEYPGNAGGRQ